MNGYLTAAGYGQAEYTDRRSRFIGHVKPVANEEEARAFVEEIRRQHADATHNVWAYSLREGGIVRWSDDGEPGGTSGQPTLHVFLSEEVVDVCCVTTRYFGGILLGSGGLVRAYTAAARAALKAAGVVRMTPWLQGSLRCPYAQYQRLCRLLRDRGARVEDSAFGAEVDILFTVPQEQAEALAAALGNATAGSILPAFGAAVPRGTPVE